MSSLTFEEFAEVWRAWKTYGGARPTAVSERSTQRRRRTRRVKSSGQRWTESDKRALLADYYAGMTVPQMARKYARSEDAIRNRLQHPRYGLLNGIGELPE